MHPNLVAGAWVGFNDARVTMRSNYWGQGGHNAVLLVGDFFRAGLDAGKIDRTALFPGGMRAATPAASPAPVDEWSEQSAPQDEGPAPEQLMRNRAQLESDMSDMSDFETDDMPAPPPPNYPQPQRQDEAPPLEFRQEPRP
jgi:penicillin-binding protein 1A